MLIGNATLPDGTVADVRIEGERIDAVGDLPGDPDLDATGKRLFPGAVDVHVHFRQPGYGHKETWASGSKSAAAGGVTTVVDQPNTDPPTVNGTTVDEKVGFAKDSVVDYGINGGVTADWNSETLFTRDLFALGEVFLADSTGDMGIGPELFEEALGHAAEADLPVTVHAEDAELFEETATERTDADAWSAYRTAGAERAAIEAATRAAEEHEVDLHIAHTSTPEGIAAAADGGATCEVTPHHLLLSRADLDELGTFGRMNPPLRSERRRELVYERVQDGTVDVIATDHAPHTREEKDASIWDAPSGVPGVETMLPLLLAEAKVGELPYERVRDLVAANPARIFGLSRKGRIDPGRDADLVLFDPDESREIAGEDLHSNCGWTPFEGFEGVFPQRVLVRGRTVYRNDDGREQFGENVGENVR